MVRKMLAAAALMSPSGCMAATEMTTIRSTTDVSPFGQQLRACFASASAAAGFNGVALVDRGGDTFVGTAGFLDPEGRVPMPSDARFRLASVTKLITRAAIGRLVDQGRLDLDGPIGRYVLNLPPEMAAITAQQLVLHRSGMPPMKQFEDNDPDFLRLMTARRATDLLPILVTRRLASAPGEREEYSNGGYMLLGIVIEAITGKTYGEYLQESVFDPLSMTASGLRATGRFATPITRRESADRSTLQVAAFRDRVGIPSGDSVSTAGDLLKFARALMGHTFLSDAVKARLFPRELPFATIFHDGATAGVETALIVAGDKDMVVVVLGNRDPGPSERVARALLGAAGIYGEGCQAGAGT